MTNHKPALNKPALGLLLFILLFILLVYTFLHEAGHALAGLAFGQNLTTFDVSFWDLSAHVRLTGSLTGPQRAIQVAAGTGLPLLIWFGFMALVPRRASFSLDLLKAASALTVLNSLLAWVIIPVLDLWGRAPAGDDVTNFLRITRFPPPLLSALALTLYAAGWLLFFVKIEGLRELWRQFRDGDRDHVLAGAQPVIAALAGIMAVAIVLTVAANNLTGVPAGVPMDPPADHQQVAQIDLHTGPYQAETVADFSLDAAGELSIFLSIQDVDTAYINLTLAGPDGFSALLLRAEGYRAGRDTSLWSETVPPGTYRVVLTAHQSPGTVTIYARDPDTPSP